jgi:hypothetical protein
MDKIKLSSRHKIDGLQKEGIYMFMDREFNTDTQEYEYFFVKSQWC